jgi:peptidoglycan/LPS O-acetylase OafA/YrhL
LCAAGRLEGLNAFLAHPGWIPFARLTFGTYLMHPVVIKWFAGTATSSYHFGWRYMAAHAMLNAAFSFLLAAGMYLLVERPVMSALKRGRRAGRDDSTRQ